MSSNDTEDPGLWAVASSIDMTWARNCPSWAAFAEGAVWAVGWAIALTAMGQAIKDNTSSNTLREWHKEWLGRNRDE